MPLELIGAQPSEDATTTEPGEGAALVEIVEGVVIATMPSAEQQAPQPAKG